LCYKVVDWHISMHQTYESAIEGKGLKSTSIAIPNLRRLPPKKARQPRETGSCAKPCEASHRCILNPCASRAQGILSRKRGLAGPPAKLEPSSPWTALRAIPKARLRPWIGKPGGLQRQFRDQMSQNRSALTANPLGVLGHSMNKRHPGFFFLSVRLAALHSAKSSISAIEPK